MGGGTTTKESAKNQVSIPSWLKPLLENTAQEFLGAQKSVPNLASLYQNVPKLNVPNLSDETMSIIGQLTGLGNKAANYLGVNATAPSQLTPKAAKGAKWEVGGEGGTDSQLVQFLASPDETVTVTTPEQEALKKMGVPGFKKGGKVKPGGLDASMLPGLEDQIAKSIANALPQGYTPPYANGLGAANPATPAPNQPPATPPSTPTGASLGKPIPPSTPVKGAGQGNDPSTLYPGAAPITQPDQSIVKKGVDAAETGLDTTKLASTALQKFLASADNGPSEATKAGEKAFADLQAPVIEQQAALMGQAGGGGLLTALAQGQEAALVPLLQTDEANQLSAATGLGNLGGTQAGIGSTIGNLGLGSAGLDLSAQEAQQGNALNQANFAQNQITQALQASGIPYDAAVQQAEALYQQLSNQFNLGQTIDTGPANLFGNLFGSSNSGTSTSTPPKF